MGSEPVSVCANTLDTSAGLAAGPSVGQPVGSGAELDSDNWSGSISTAGGITEVYGRTTFKGGSQCSTQPDSYTNWVGIGGWDSTKLLQNGFWNGHTTNSFLFYEAIDGTTDTGTVPVTIANTNQGDTFNISTTYSAGTATFSWHDLTTGATGNISSSTFANLPASDFWDDWTGEAVDERGAIAKKYTTLRDFGTDPWQMVEVNSDGAGLTYIRQGADHNGLFIVYNGAYLSKPTSGANDGEFTDTWYGCGGEGPEVPSVSLKRRLEAARRRVKPARLARRRRPHGCG
ncbi:hypothetical protein ACFOYW_15175 [Gryllotalpicola reticulitermitis]|uniref:Uncharacterized protein n=1 Tax=Gryllotalpicola reticulitermitis TaxID=1184153 RepID=A0ABV8QB18_9MICO